MGFITYVLLTAIVVGTGFRFTPEVFGVAVSNGFVWLLIEILCLKFGFYLFCTKEDNPSPATLDFVSYSGYKFVGACVVTLMQLILGNWGYRISVLYCGVCSALLIRNYYFLICPKGSDPARYFIAFAMLLQVVILFAISRAA